MPVVQGGCQSRRRHSLAHPRLGPASYLSRIFPLSLSSPARRLLSAVGRPIPTATCLRNLSAAAPARSAAPAASRFVHRMPRHAARMPIVQGIDGCILVRRDARDMQPVPPPGPAMLGPAAGLHRHRHDGARAEAPGPQEEGDGQSSAASKERRGCCCVGCAKQDDCASPCHGRQRHLLHRAPEPRRGGQGRDRHPLPLQAPYL